MNDSNLASPSFSLKKYFNIKIHNLHIITSDLSLNFLLRVASDLTLMILKLLMTKSGCEDSKFARQNCKTRNERGCERAFARVKICNPKRGGRELGDLRRD